MPDREIAVRGERRRIRPKTGRLTDRFEAYSTHVYELRIPPDAAPAAGR